MACSLQTDVSVKVVADSVEVPSGSLVVTGFDVKVGLWVWGGGGGGGGGLDR